jgi:threonine synthase
VIVATSGDTGSAAIAALRGLAGVDVVVLHPHQRTSEVQRRQMTTVLDSNVHNIAVQGTFDDAQNIVKALFADAPFAARTQLTAVNSINFARIMAQCVYYFTAAAAIGGRAVRAPSFVVPTGNFGDVFAGEAAARMGLAIERLVIATNSNDILVRALTSGVYSAGRVQQTLSPSMDIQVASNFERAVFEAAGRNGAFVCGVMQQFAATRSLPIPKWILVELQRRYLAASGSDDETRAAIAQVYKETGKILDPHTAVGVAALLKLGKGLAGPVILLATAHPAKFPEAITQAIGIAPVIPPKLAGLMAQEERYTVLPNEVGAVRTFVLERTGTL